MTYLAAGLAAAVLLLGGGLLIVMRYAIGTAGSAETAEASAKEANDKIIEISAYERERERIREDAEKKKSKISTGDSGADFDNSVGLLHDGKDGKVPPRN